MWFESSRDTYWDILNWIYDKQIKNLTKVRVGRWIRRMCVFISGIIHVFHWVNHRKVQWVFPEAGECPHSAAGAEWQNNTKRHRELFGRLWACLLFGSVSMTQRDIPRCLQTPTPHLASLPFPSLLTLPYPSFHPLNVTPFFHSLPPTMFIPHTKSGGFRGLLKA